MAIRLHHQVEGDGPWLAMSHGMACNLSAWDDQCEALRKSFRILRYDTRGHGRSGAPAGEYTMDDLAEDFRALLDALNIGKVAFLGLSMGGMIGLAFALKYPDRLAGLIAANCTSGYGPPYAAAWTQRIASVTADGMEAMVTPTLGRFFTEGFLRANSLGVRKTAEMIRRTPLQGFIGCCHALAAADMSARLPEIRVPTLLMAAEKDIAVTVETVRGMHEAIRGSKLAIISNAAHLSNVEQPNAFTNEALSFLKTTT